MKSILILAAAFGIATIDAAPEGRVARPPLASACYGADSYSARQTIQFLPLPS